MPGSTSKGRVRMCRGSIYIPSQSPSSVPGISLSRGLNLGGLLGFRFTSETPVGRGRIEKKQVFDVRVERSILEWEV